MLLTTVAMFSRSLPRRLRSPPGRVVALCLAACFALHTAPSQGWSNSGGNAQRNGIAAAFGPPAPQILWSTGPSSTTAWMRSSSPTACSSSASLAGWFSAQIGLLLSRAAEVRIGDAAEPAFVRRLDAIGGNPTAGTVVNFGSFGQPRYAAAAFQLEGGGCWGSGVAPWLHRRQGAVPAAGRVHGLAVRGRHGIHEAGAG